MKLFSIVPALALLLICQVSSFPLESAENVDIVARLAENLPQTSPVKSSPKRDNDIESNPASLYFSVGKAAASTETISGSKRDTDKAWMTSDELSAWADQNIPRDSLDRIVARDNAIELVPNEELNAWIEKNLPRNVISERDEAGIDTIRLLPNKEMDAWIGKNFSRDVEKRGQEMHQLGKRSVNECLVCMFGCFLTNAGTPLFRDQTTAFNVAFCLGGCANSQLELCNTYDRAQYRQRIGNAWPAPATGAYGYTYAYWTSIPANPQP